MRVAEAHTLLARRDQESDDAAKYVQELSRNPDSFNHWDRETLVHLIKEAGVHIRRLEAETRGLHETVSATEKMRAKYGDVTSQLSELQDAHLIQAKNLQKLKLRASKVQSLSLMYCRILKSKYLRIGKFLRRDNKSTGGSYYENAVRSRDSA